MDPAFHLDLFKGSRTFNFRLTYDDIYPDFEVANGFLQRKDYRQGGAHFWYDIRQGDTFLGLIRPSVYFSQMYNHAGIKIEGYIAPALTVETQDSHAFTLGYYNQFEEYAGFDFTKNWYYVQYGNKTFKWLIFDSRFYFGDAIYYDAVYYGQDPFLGRFRSFDINLNLRPLNNLSFIIGIKNYLFDGSYYDVKYRTNQDIYQYNNLFEDFDFNGLLSYQPFPGTVFFLGYNDHFQNYNSGIDQFEKNIYIRDFRSVFIKISYLFRF